MSISFIFATEQKVLIKKHLAIFYSLVVMSGDTTKHENVL
jgi:hypothetical protein